MVESIVGVLAAVSVTVSAGLTAAVLRLNKRSQQLQKALIALKQEVAAQNAHVSVDAVNSDSSLSGLRIAVAIEQDHSIPTLSLLLKDALINCDAEVTLIDPVEASSLASNWGSDPLREQPDVLIWGSIACNGYREFYYKASLNYLTPYGALNPTSEQPAQGNPQGSLVVSVVIKLKHELDTAQRRYERGRAIQELRQDDVLRQIQK